MRKRSTDILQYLIKNKGKIIYIGKLADKFEVSKKTLKNDFKEINQLLSTVPADEIKSDREGRLLFGKNFDEEKIKKGPLYNDALYLQAFA
ncbi:MAG: HTH domain-containing protein [Clostridiales bacterium]|nr:HTH domain-containing protein [Clostridiales bacterium]